MRELDSIDLSSLTERYGEESLESLIEVFLRKMPSELLRLKNAMPSRNKSELKNLIHGLKGSCSVMYANQMKQNCADLEEAVSRDDWNQASSLSEYLYGSFDELQKELKDFVPDKSQSNFRVD